MTGTGLGCRAPLGKLEPTDFLSGGVFLPWKSHLLLEAPPGLTAMCQPSHLDGLWEAGQPRPLELGGDETPLELGLHSGGWGGWQTMPFLPAGLFGGRVLVLTP